MGVFFHLTIVLCLISLSIWQFFRGLEKKNFIDEYSLSKIEKTYDAISLTKEIDKKNRYFYQFKDKGIFLKNFYILLDNQVYKKQVGYQIYVPFKITKPFKVYYFLVNLGWVSADFDRNILPDLPVLPDDELFVSGILMKKNLPFLLKKDFFEKFNVNNNQIYRVQSIDINLINEQLNSNFNLYTLTLDQHFEFSLKNTWNLDFIKPAKHYGYALQWFLMMIVYLVMIYNFIYKKSNYEK